MIKHIVLFKMKEFDTISVKNDFMVRFKAKLEELPAIIPQIRDYEVGINQSESPHAYDISLISVFDSNEDFEVYRKHPTHQAVLDFARQVTAKFRVVDYHIQ